MPVHKLSQTHGFVSMWRWNIGSRKSVLSADWYFVTLKHPGTFALNFACGVGGKEPNGSSFSQIFSLTLTSVLCFNSSPDVFVDWSHRRHPDTSLCKVGQSDSAWPLVSVLATNLKLPQICETPFLAKSKNKTTHAPISKVWETNQKTNKSREDCVVWRSDWRPCLMRQPWST